MRWGRRKARSRQQSGMLSAIRLAVLVNIMSAPSSLGHDHRRIEVGSGVKAVVPTPTRGAGGTAAQGSGPELVLEGFGDVDRQLLRGSTKKVAKALGHDGKA